MRISRPCYDKWWRCPGWAGPGFRYPKHEGRCDNGNIGHTCPAWVEGRPRWASWAWHFHRCPVCRVIVLPYVVRYVDWTWWRFRVVSWWRYKRPGAA